VNSALQALGMNDVFIKEKVDLFGLDGTKNLHIWYCYSHDVDADAI